MVEKFLKTDIVEQPWAIYEVSRGGVVIMKSQNNMRDVIMFLSIDKANELNETWDIYNYFIDKDGDISRTRKYGE